MTFEYQLFTDKEKQINELLYFDTIRFHRKVTVGNKCYQIDQEASLLGVVTILHIHCNEVEGESMNVTVMLRRQRSVLWFPEKYYIDVCWWYPRFDCIHQELTPEEYSKLMEGLSKLLKTFTR